MPIQKTAETVEAGQIIIIVHKAKDIEKKGTFGPIPSFALVHLVNSSGAQGLLDLFRSIA